MTQKRKEFRSFVFAAFVACALGQTAFAQRVPAEKAASVQTDAQRLIPANPAPGQVDVQRLIPAKPASEQMAPEEFRKVLMTFTALTGAASQTSNPLAYRIADLSTEEMQALYDVFPAPRTFSTNVERLASRRAGVNSTPLPDEGGEGTAGIIGVLSPCASFDPDYPSGGWLGFIEGILGVDLLDEKSRCDEDLEMGFTIAHTALQIAATIAQAVCDAAPDVLGEGTNTIPCAAAGVANALKDAAQFVLDACAALDDEVNSAEIEAGYENTKIIIDALCCKSVDQHRKYQGCNGQDDDCDGTIDECAEDTFGPDVFVDPSVRGKCYKDAGEANSALFAATEASDDCGRVVGIGTGTTGAECDVEGFVTVNDDCGNLTTVPGIGFRIDGEAPQVTCSVAISELFPPNHSYTDVGFSYTATDNCGGDLKVEVKVTSDEQTTLPPGSGKASAFPDAVIERLVDGTIVGVLLRNERGMPSDGRVYQIHVFATDQCGNVGKAECNVSVSPADGKPAVDSGQYFDATGIN